MNPKGKPILRLNVSNDPDPATLPKTNGSSLQLGSDPIPEPMNMLSVNGMDQSPFKGMNFHDDRNSTFQEGDIWLNPGQLPEGDAVGTYRPESIVGRSVFGNFFTNSVFNSKNNSVRPTGKRFDLSLARERSPSPGTRSPIRSASPIHISVRKVSDPPKYRTTKNQRLLRLYDALMKIFLQDDTTICRSALNPVEQLLLVRVVRRKFGRPEWSHVERLMSEFQKEVDQVVPLRPAESKRKEEKVKFIYKMVLKKLKRRFEKSRGLPKDACEPFYEHYFGAVSERLAVPLPHFFDPSNNKRKDGDAPDGRFKTINSEFLQLVFTSESFRTDFLDYLRSPDLLTDYQDKLGKKIRKLLTRWNKLVGKLPDAEIRRRADEYFIASERCKLPWAVFEVRLARDHFLQHAFKMEGVADPTNTRQP